MKLTKKACVFLSVNMLSWLLLIWLPAQHAKMSIVLIFALSGWGLGVLPQPVVSLLIIVSIPLIGLGSFAESLAGFSQPFVWLLVSTFILASALKNTGVGKRLALLLLLQARGKTGPILLYGLLALVILGFLVPTASGRSAMIMPVCIGMIEVLRERKASEHFAKNVMLGVAFTSSFMSWALITGSSSSIYLVSSLEALTGFRWNYLDWFVCHFPLLLFLVFGLWWLLRKIFPLEIGEVPGGYEYIRQELASLGKIKREEGKISLIGMLTLLGWMSEPYHHLSVSLLALLAAVASCLPLIGVQTWKQASAEISWDVVILFGAGVALADALQRNGTAAWLADCLAASLPVLDPAAAALFVIVAVLLFRLGFANMLAITATFLPVVVNLANNWGIHPVWLSQVMLIACSFGNFFPFQSPSNLITYSYGYYDQRDLFRAGVFLSLFALLATWMCALFYWPLLGLVPR